MYSWVFVNLANVLFALAYLVKDIFWLRTISIIACIANMVYLYVAPDKPLWWGIGWDACFVGINTVQIWILFREQRTLHFGTEENELFATVFKNLSPLEFRRLLNVARWDDTPVGSVLAREDERLSSLMLISRGTARVEKNERFITTLKPGDFIGEMSFVSATAASATVKAGESTRLLCWDKDKLQTLLAGDPGLKMSLDTVLSCNMAEKLKRQNNQPSTI